ncbi:uncharacterized protein PITG_02019 [Phytophthora infestans T30-4]|uniref:Uncharacterized protein n=1 Tax=Phytophthora infestans (strain T30-4) TaxID=403677 RepID=D0MUN4_PHYIT|nr:uncharacterized protein PITG_02019 [Phytophthora infestans T30-4]EEY61681.1 conserved hypothetical protein [Phytophthora infestans T30-4]|eukprot:XP_002908598.1 conserved hypothetical protein [Phytophthora infestans T30-4]
MYIGPWQEYRLAKIQDDAIQRLRQEWEATLSGQLAPGDDDRIRELMQPLVAKLPSMLLAANRPESARSSNNQETHDPSSSRAPFKPPRPKKGKKLTALEQVQKRKKMFATWIKEAAPANPSNQAPIVSPTISAPSNAADIDLDESVDEEELNKLLNWTDTLLSPHALDSLCDFDS